MIKKDRFNPTKKKNIAEKQTNKIHKFSFSRAQNRNLWSRMYKIVFSSKYLQEKDVNEKNWEGYFRNIELNIVRKIKSDNMILMK